jgi:membrane protein DedA with SNARE-associated domain
VFFLGIIGWLMGSAYAQMAENIDSLEIIGYCAIAIMVGFGIYYLYKNKKKLKKLK